MKTNNNEVQGASTEETIETSQENRFVFWKEVVARLTANQDINRAVSAGVNATVGSYIKLSAEAVAGKTLDGQKLTPLGRLIDAFIVGTGLGGYVLAATGNLQAAGASYGLSWFGWGIMYGRDLLKPLLKKSRESLASSSSSQARLLGVIENTLSASKNLFFAKEQKNDG